jgi:shikimate kinase
MRSVAESQVLVLTGFMGAGKSTTGAAIARRLGYAFVEIDESIEQLDGRRIPEIFQVSGEPYFRQLEHKILRELLDQPRRLPLVISLGGGAFVQPQNFELLQKTRCITIFLDAEPEELFRRCVSQSSISDIKRPLCDSFDDFRNLYLGRRDKYLAATLRVDTGGKDVNAVVTEILCNLKLLNSAEPLPGQS